MSKEPYAGIFVAAGHMAKPSGWASCCRTRILEGMPDGIVLLSADNTIIWGNGRIPEWTANNQWWAKTSTPPSIAPILGPVFPFHTALITGKAASSVPRSGDNPYFHFTPSVSEGTKAPEHLIVTVHDVTKEILQQQKLAAIHQAGQELSDLTTEELSHMSIDEPIKPLKSNILHYTKDLLHFDVVEIRLLDQKTNRLEPLLAVGIGPRPNSIVLSPCRKTMVRHVAANGKSYLCDDTREDPLYLQGLGGRSSLTVPSPAGRGYRHF